LTHRNAGNQIFLVSDGLDISTSRLVREMSKSAVVPSKLIYVPIWLLQTVGLITGKQNAVASICNSLQIDSTKAKTLLKWNPPISFVEGIRRAMSDS
jgi:nucleoside-diphosphate-sugar epimerase